MTPVQLPEVPAPVSGTNALIGGYTVWVAPASNYYTAAQLREYATAYGDAILAVLLATGSDHRVNEDTFFAAVDAARSHIGSCRPDNEDPEDQWMWDKLTTLMDFLTPSETNSER